MDLFNKIFKGISQRFSKSGEEVEYESHKNKKQLLIIDSLIFVILLTIPLRVFPPDFLLIAIYFLLYPYLFLTVRKSAIYHLLISSVIALIWIFIAKDQYGYNLGTLNVLGIHLLPLFTAAAGLFAVYLLYSHWEYILGRQSFFKKMLLFVAFYWTILISFETIVYHVFNIKNLSTVMYAGLPICDCIHAPRWMQISYLSLGPIYFSICELIGLKNPHYIRKKK